MNFSSNANMNIITEPWPPAANPALGVRALHKQSGISVLNAVMKQRVEAILNQFPQRAQPQVTVKSNWYY